MPVLTAARGLQTQKSSLTRPDGALSVADNIVVDFDNTIQKRRGFRDYTTGAFNSKPKQLFTYRSKIISHYENTLTYDSDSLGSFANFSGNFSEAINGLRIKSVESNGNLYFTTSTGIKKISAKEASDINTNSVTEAGGVKAIDLSGRVVPEASGFLPSQAKVAYRIVFGTKDSNNNLIIGSPSSRLVLTNASKDVKVSEVFTVNITNISGITTGDYFLFDLADSGYFIYFDKDGTTEAPVNADTLNRTGIKIKTSDAPSNETTAARIANELTSNVSGIEVELSGTEVEITVTDPGDVTDVSQGNVNAAYVKVTKVVDGSITTGSPASTSLTSILPSTITTNYFYQLYRTAVVSVTPGLTLNDVEPGDEQYFVFEAPITDADIAAGKVTISDNTPEIFRESGAYLYTNATTGAGIISANEKPPVATDISMFRNSTFYANTKDVHRFSFNMLSVDDFVSGSTALTIGKNGTTRTFTFTGAPEVINFTVKSKSQTVGGSHIEISSSDNERQYYVWFDKGIITHTFDSTSDVVNDIIGIPNHGFATHDKVVFSGTVPGGITAGQTYYVVKMNDGSFGVRVNMTDAPIVMTDVVGTATITHTSVEPVVAGKLGIRLPLELYDNTVDESKSALITALNFTGDFLAEDAGGSIVRVTIADNGNVDTPAHSSPASGWTFSVVTEGEGEDAATNKVLLSSNSSVAVAIDQTARSLVRIINYDALCPVFAQYLTGADDLPGKILLEAKSGEDVEFWVQISDAALSAEFSPEISAVANTTKSDNNEGPNRIYFSKTLQPEAVPISHYIDVGSKDKPILRILPLRDNLFVLKEDGIYILTGDVAPNFSVRLLDNSATLIAPDSAAVLNNLIYALTTQGVVSISETGVSIISRDIEDLIKQVTTFNYNFKYTSFGVAYESDRAYLLWLPTNRTDNVATQCFRFNSITNTWTRWILTNSCGIVNQTDDRLYLGSGDRFHIVQERKEGSREDYADRDFVRTIGADGINGNDITISSTIDVVSGDVIVQDQYLTKVKFNRFLQKLDTDASTADKDYFDLLQADLGSNLATKLQELVTKLNLDANLVDTFTVPSGVNTKEAMLADFNIIIDELNHPTSGTSFKDYKRLTDLIRYEVLIEDVDTITNTVTVNFMPWLLQGEITIFKSYECKVQWAPQHFGKPEIMKQIHEGTLLFEQGTIYGASIAYSSDRSASFEEVPFAMQGPVIVYNTDSFEEITFKMQGPGTWGSYNWANSVWGGAGNSVPLRTLVPAQKSRCRFMNVRFKHKNAREAFKLLGISLEVREVSTRGYR